MARGYWVGFCAASWLLGCSGGTSPAAEVSDSSPTVPRSEVEELTKNALSPAQAKTVLTLIDDICGDTWCDGDYDFGFRRLTCAKAARTCTLTLQVFPRDGVPSSAKSYWRSCKTSGFTGFASLVSTGPSGYQSLQNDYYDALTECMFQIEDKLR
ncbi:MAG TPA: hypothetical protein VNW92_29560 [Polyangiaceae bacterium]|nr:hypothetical protein [Polyangiaceae bacterium]